jgi:hypothetical protein
MDTRLMERIAGRGSLRFGRVCNRRPLEGFLELLCHVGQDGGVLGCGL